MSIRSTIALQSARNSALRDNRELERQIRDLERQVDRLTLASLAMAEILRDRLGITGEMIEDKIREIDLRDGKLDGRLRPSARPCGECGRVNGPTHPSCLYCGAPLPEEPLLSG